ncbi:hypothetical protein Tco_1153174 [Tanacetum coccineum]
MRGSFLSSSRAFTGGGFFGKGANANTSNTREHKSGATLDHVQNTANRRDLSQSEHTPGKSIASTDDKNINRPVQVESQPPAPKKSWQQLFTRTSTVPPSSSSNVISRPKENSQKEVQSPVSSGYTATQGFDNPLSFELPYTLPNFGYGDPVISTGLQLSSNSIFPRVGEAPGKFLPEESEIFEDPCYVPDPIALIGPVSESLDNFQSDLGFAPTIGYQKPHPVKRLGELSEVSRPSPIESPMSRFLPRAHEMNSSPVEDQGKTSDKGWQMWDSLGLAGDPSSWLLPPELNGLNKEGVTQPQQQKTMASLFKKDDQVPFNTQSSQEPSQNGRTYSRFVPAEDDPWMPRTLYGPISGSDKQLPLNLQEHTTQNELVYGNLNGSAANHPFQLSQGNFWAKSAPVHLFLTFLGHPFFPWFWDRSLKNYFARGTLWDINRALFVGVHLIMPCIETTISSFSKHRNTIVTELSNRRRDGAVYPVSLEGKGSASTTRPVGGLYPTRDVQSLASTLDRLPSGLLFHAGLATTWEFSGFLPVFKDTEGNVVTMSEYLRFPFLDGATIEQGDALSARDATVSHTTGPLPERKARAAAKKRTERKRVAGGEGGSKGKPKRRKVSAVRPEERDSTEEASSASPLRTVAPNPSFLLKDVDEGTAESREDEHVIVPHHDSANTNPEHIVEHDESFGESRGHGDTAETHSVDGLRSLRWEMSPPVLVQVMFPSGPSIRRYSSGTLRNAGNSRTDFTHAVYLVQYFVQQNICGRGEHAGCAEKLVNAERERDELRAVNADQVSQIKELEAELARKDSALVFSDRVSNERAVEIEKLVSKPGCRRLLIAWYKESLSIPFNLAIQAGWAKGLAMKRSEKDLMDVFGHLSSFLEELLKMYPAPPPPDAPTKVNPSSQAPDSSTSVPKGANV